MIESALLYIAETPLSVSIPLTVAIAVAISCFSTFVVSEIYTYPELSANNEVVGIKFGYFGEIFAVSLGLALLGAYSVYMGVREISINEVTTLRSLYYSESAQSAGPDAAESQNRKQAVLGYAKSVVDEEWSLQAHSRISEKTTVKLKQVFDAFVRGSVNNPLITTQMSWLNDLVKLRQMRTTTLTRSLSLLLWVILVIGTALSLVIPLFIGSQHFVTHAILSSLFSTFILLHLLVIVHLAYPFTGDVGITAGLYVDFLEEVRRGGANYWAR